MQSRSTARGGARSAPRHRPSACARRRRGRGSPPLSELTALSCSSEPTRRSWPRATLMRELSHEGDQHRLLLPLALINASLGRLEVAARVVGFDDAVRTRNGENANVFAPLVGGRLDALLAGLASEERARLSREGASLDETRPSNFGRVRSNYCPISTNETDPIGPARGSSRGASGFVGLEPAATTRSFAACGSRPSSRTSAPGCRTSAPAG